MNSSPVRRERGPLVWSLPLDERHPGEPLQSWLYEGIRKAIVAGRLPPDSLLPGSRSLAQHYGVARGTAQTVYDRLLSEGYLDARPGSGTRVSALLPELRVTPPPAQPSAPGQRRPEPIGQWAAKLAGLEPPFPMNVAGSTPYPFAPHRPDVRNFPIDIWRRLQARQLRASRIDSLWPTDGPGHLPLRQVIAQQLAISRGLSTQPEQIIILGSVQQALDLCIRLVTTPGDAVWMEDPGYNAARQLLLGAALRVVDVGIDEHGMRVEDGISRAPDARLVYTTPCHHSPSGTVMSRERRMQMLQWAAETGALIFEDDYNSEFSFSGNPISALGSFPGAESRVVFAGTFSKLLFPAIRIAYIVCPPHLVDAFTRAASLTLRQTNWPLQTVLAEFILEGHFDQHVRRMRKIYVARAQAFHHAAQRYWQGLIDVDRPHAGLDTVGRLVDMDEATALRRLAKAGVMAFPMGKYTGSHTAAPALVMGFAPFTETEIDNAARVAADALRQPDA
ncbi:PLP-dependent aminotransferase family protein [Bordetella petrii]|uniref:MocR-like pyridoxine biosynthesis transcription factor PdxR n=1 Tax=Bordetella petrii TaxID=94624 RepID=UPI001A971F98|nr:PLP-dependent aminotransferase family protein [Bordetella petrii]MBO1114049.1 PLP-dependent aminotransferase family protein [Bordetella petrii]